MATLGEMITEIVEETRRYDPNWSSRVRREIEKAVSFYQRERFWFNETREITFDTVIGQEFYTDADQADIPNLIAIDYITVTDGTTIVELCPVSARWHDTDDFATAANLPTEYSYTEGKLRIWPKPNKVYPLRIAGLPRRAFPASDAEPDNPWMTEAEELIRSRAKRNLYLHHMGSRSKAEDMKAAEDEALRALRAETSRRTNVHTFTPAEVY
jgi:hypothetical protein